MTTTSDTDYIKGYTKGRRLTASFVKEVAKLYKTKSEFYNRDITAYAAARKMGILDEICSHMHVCSFSLPQRILFNIMNQLLNVAGQYNTRQIIKPFELDIFYPTYNLAFEYSGKGWHTSPEAVARDATKRIRCAAANITLIEIKETSRRYEEDIKQQLKNNIDIINSTCKSNISPTTVENIVVDYAGVFSVYNIEIVKEAIAKCNTIAEFRKTYGHFIVPLKHLNMGKLLDDLRKPKSPWIFDSEKDVLNYVKHTFATYTEFSYSAGCYTYCSRRKLIPQIKPLLKPSRGKWCLLSNDELLEIAKQCKTYSDFFSHPIYSTCIERNLLPEIREMLGKITAENIKKFSDNEFITLCQNQFKTYYDFTTSIMFFQEAKRRNMKKQIRDLYPLKKKNGKWTLLSVDQFIQHILATFSTYSDFVKSNEIVGQGEYQYAAKNKLLKLIKEAYTIK